MADNVISNFDTEVASEFITEISMNGYGLIGIAIERLLDEDIRASLTECEEAIVASEMVAAAIGNPSIAFPEDATEWLAMYLPKGSLENIEVCKLAVAAADAIDKIMADSELRDLWDENPDFDEWFQLQVDLQKRILGDA